MQGLIQTIGTRKTGRMMRARIVSVVGVRVIVAEVGAVPVVGVIVRHCFPYRIGPIIGVSGNTGWYILFL